MVGAALARRLDQLGPQHDVLVPAALVDVVVLEEHGGRQHHVGHLRGGRHELLVDADEQVLAREACLHLALLGRHLHGVGVLDEEGGHGRAALDVVGVAGEHRADARLVEHPHVGVGDVQAFDQRLVPVVDGAVVVEAAAAFVEPRAGHGRDAQGRVHVVGAVARAGEAVSEPEIGPRRRTHHFGKRLDLGDGQSGYRARPRRRAARQVRFELARAVGVFLQIRPVGIAVAEQHVHHRAGERAVGAGPEAQGEVGLRHGAVVVDVDGDDLGAPLLAGAHRVRHHVDLGVDGVGAPDHHEVGFGHLARIGAGELAGAGDVARPRQRRANGGVHVGVALGVAQPVDAVAHDEAHGAGIVVGPHGLGAVAALGRQQGLRGEVEGIVPGDALELARALRPLAPQRMHEPVGVMHALGIARDLGADDARRIAVVLRPVHAAYPAVGQQLDVERAGRGAIVRTDGVADLDLGVDIHGWAFRGFAICPRLARVRCEIKRGQTPCEPGLRRNRKGQARGLTPLARLAVCAPIDESPTHGPAH